MNIHYTFVDPEVANIFATSMYASRKYPGLSQGVLRAISIGRHLLDPLMEFSRLCNRDRELLCLRLHPLQDMINQDVLYDVLERVFVSIVNAVGVNINQAINHDWKAHLLSHVAGLGPRKATYLLQELRKTTLGISLRSELERYLGKQSKVYRNAIGFLKLSSLDINVKYNDQVCNEQS